MPLPTKHTVKYQHKECGMMMNEQHPIVGDREIIRENCHVGAGAVIAGVIELRQLSYQFDKLLIKSPFGSLQSSL